MKRILMAAAAALGLFSGQARAQGFSDTSVGVRDGWTRLEPRRALGGRA